MTYLLWSLLNVFLLLYFIYLLVGFVAKGRKVFHPKFKIISIIILIAGVYSIISSSKSEEKSNRIVIIENYDSNKNSEFKKVILEKNLTFDISMGVTFSSEEDKLIFIESYSDLVGFVLGFDWEYNDVKIFNHESTEKVQYSSIGTLNWKLLGITVIKDTKSYDGIIELK